MKIIKGNIFESKMQTLVNPVNCVGVMGRGLAKEFKIKYPMMFYYYNKRCKEGKIIIGKTYLYSQKNDKHCILLFPTKYHWKNTSFIEDIEKGLDDFVFSVENNLYQHQITSVAFPALGCGLGGLKWKDVKPLMIKKLKKMKIKTEIYEPK